MKILKIYFTNLSGEIPNFNLPNLNELVLIKNQHTGKIPNFTLPNLRYLQLSRNELVDTVPSFNLPLLEVLAINENKLTYVPTLNLAKLEQLVLSDNKIENKILDFRLPKIKSLEIANNFISELTDLTSISTWNDNLGSHGIAGQVLNIKNNRFTFSKILNSINIFNAWNNKSTYTPQDSIYKDTTFTITEGGSLTVDLDIDGAITDNSYKWFKNGILYRTTTTNKLPLSNLQITDAGVYTCQVTNPRAPLLTLYSKKIVIVIKSNSVVCQSISANITANPSVTSGSVIKICKGTKVQFIGSGIYPQNNTTYSQSDALSTFSWSLCDSTLIGKAIEYTFNNSGSFQFRLNITDTAKCVGSSAITIQVAAKPSFSISSPKKVVLGDSIKLKANLNIIDTTNFNISLNNPILGSGGVYSCFNQPLFIPDNPAQEYKTSLLISNFNQGQTLTNIDDLAGIFVNMEHSWVRDLEIKITCPNNQNTILHKYDVRTRNINELYVGIPNDNDAIFVQYVNDKSHNPPGTGLRYEWTPTETNTWRSYTKPILFSIPLGKYKPDNSLTALVGCPLNGEWTLSVKDQFEYDNGWIFSWGVGFKPTGVSSDTFSTNIVSSKWLSPANLITDFGDSILVKPVQCGLFTYKFQTTDNFGCNSDTALTQIRVTSKNARSHFLKPNEILNLNGSVYMVSGAACNSIATPCFDTIYNASIVHTLRPAALNLNCNSGIITISKSDSCTNIVHNTTYNWYKVNTNGSLSFYASSNQLTTNTADSFAVIVKDSVTVKGKPESGYKIYYDTLRIRISGTGQADVPSQPILVNGSSSVCQGSTTIYTLASYPPKADTLFWTLLRGSGTIISGQGTNNISVKWLGTATRDTLRVIGKNACFSSIPRDLIIDISTFQNLNAGSDTLLCGLSTPLRAISGGGTGTWTSIAGNSGVAVFQNSNQATSTVTVNTAGTYRFSWTEAKGSCSLSDTLAVTFAPIIITTPLSKSICQGQTYTLPKGRIVSTAGTYRDTLKSAGGCDSVIVTTLSINSIITTPLSRSICQGQTYTLPKGRVVSTAGTYRDTLKSVGGCDTIIITTLSVNISTSVSISRSICQRQTYVLPKGRIVSAAGIYRDTFKNTSGCDSIIVTTLSIIPPKVEKATQRICSGSNYRLSNGSIATKGGIYRDTLRSASGCDTILEITLILDTVKVIKDDTLCPGQKYRLPSGKEVTELTTHRDIVKRQGQCDTIYFITLTEGCLTRLKIFNGLTPDGAFNRNFVVEGIDDYPQAKLFIYTRTNALIFQSKIPYDNLWNGTDQNGTPLPADTYYYILDLGVLNQKPLQGYILLAR